VTAFFGWGRSGQCEDGGLDREKAGHGFGEVFRFERATILFRGVDGFLGGGIVDLF
jgi:hypothetical protein